MKVTETTSVTRAGFPLTPKVERVLMQVNMTSIVTPESILSLTAISRTGWV